jgi:hypothetical protein
VSLTEHRPSPFPAPDFSDECVHFVFPRFDALDEFELGAATVEVVAGVVGLEIDVSFQMVG